MKVQLINTIYDVDGNVVAETGEIFTVKNAVKIMGKEPLEVYEIVNGEYTGFCLGKIDCVNLSMLN
ncbi:hypothetical protein [Peribacillus sp. SCS-155]|uniref:hypothetical protein n=1 Tax=Peribacillus sedimenti TaxID=3115297 RepID=UPI0039059D2A